MGPSLVIITSLVLGDNPTHNMSSVWSRTHNIDHDADRRQRRTTMWKIECPIFAGPLYGNGGLVCATLLLAHTTLEHHSDDDGTAMDRVINTMYAIPERTDTQAAGTASTLVQSRELKLIQSKNIIENPPLRFGAQKLWKINSNRPRQQLFLLLVGTRGIYTPPECDIEDKHVHGGNRQLQQLFLFLVGSFGTNSVRV
jgi:hypothetical protein